MDCTWIWGCGRWNQKNFEDVGNRVLKHKNTEKHCRHLLRISRLRDYIDFIQKAWFLTAAAKLLQSCPTLCDPIDGNPPGSPIPGILQARTLGWVASSFSSARKWSRSVVPTRLLRPWDFPGKSTGVECHCLLRFLTTRGKKDLDLLFKRNLSVVSENHNIYTWLLLRLLKAYIWNSLDSSNVIKGYNGRLLS